LCSRANINFGRTLLCSVPGNEVADATAKETDLHQTRRWVVMFAPLFIALFCRHGKAIGPRQWTRNYEL
jgi:hypothetical protein